MFLRIFPPARLLRPTRLFGTLEYSTFIILSEVKMTFCGTTEVFQYKSPMENLGGESLSQSKFNFAPNKNSPTEMSGVIVATYLLC